MTAVAMVLFAGGGLAAVLSLYRTADLVVVGQLMVVSLSLLYGNDVS